jgi:hypothetical protein
MYTSGNTDLISQACIASRECRLCHGAGMSSCLSGYVHHRSLATLLRASVPISPTTSTVHIISCSPFLPLQIIKNLREWGISASMKKIFNDKNEKRKMKLETKGILWAGYTRPLSTIHMHHPSQLLSTP